MKTENLTGNTNNLILKDWVKSLKFRTLDEPQFKRVKKWWHCLKNENPQFLKKQLDDITIAEWGKFGSLFDLLGEAESKTFILKYYPDHLDDIKSMKHWDLGYVILNGKVENGERLTDWETFSKTVAVKYKEWLL
ncbi:MAG: hypothetical protein NC489_29090 [Ruminococcus flavefaciens]|nr:hypothetical protein [Ruminococcus flavefaciens]